MAKSRFKWLNAAFFQVTQMLNIRKANPSDAHMISENNCAMAMETEGKVIDPMQAALGVDGLFQHPDFGFYLVAEEAGESVASLMVTYEWSDWRNGLIWWIQSVYVREPFRRRGIYRQMYACLQQMAKASKIPVCGFRLYVENENTSAQQTYRELGMKRCAYQIFEESWSALDK